LEGPKGITILLVEVEEERQALTVMEPVGATEKVLLIMVVVVEEEMVEEVMALMEEPLQEVTAGIITQGPVMAMVEV
jgi:hypothetical protein